MVRGWVELGWSVCHEVEDEWAMRVVMLFAVFVGRIT